MREMKDSGIEWIGEIPESWKVSRIKQLFSEVNDRCENGENYTLLSVSEYYGVAPKIERISDDDMLTHAETLDGYKICKENDLVMNIMLAWKRALGVSEYTGIVSPAYCIYRAKQNMCAKYFHYLFRTDMYANLFKQYSTGIIDSRLRLYPDKFLALKCQVPPIDTQRRIAAYLDRKCSQIDAIMARQQEVIEKLKAYKLSVITEAVTKGLNPDVPMKDSGVEWIGEIPDFWNVVPLKTCADILPGYAFSSDDFDIENGTALLRGINVTPNGIRWEDVVYWNNPITEQLRTFELVAGDIVVGLDRPWVSGGTRVCWVTQKDLPALLLQRVCRIRAKENIDSRWIYHWIASKSFQEALSIETTGVSVPHISTKQIERFSITLPPIEVQHQICDTLEVKCYSVGNVIDKKQAIIDKLTQYKKSLIYEVVTGKKEV